MRNVTGIEGAICVIAFVLTIALVNVGCIGTYNTNSSKIGSAETEERISLVGHWNSKMGDHLYFAPVDLSTGNGVHIIVQAPPLNRTFHHKYEVVDHSEDAFKLRIFYGTDDEVVSTFRISQRHRSLTEEREFEGLSKPVLTTYFRVDNDTAPN